MLLSFAQIEALKNDLDYILARSQCDTLQRTRSHVMAAMLREPDVILDLVQGMRPDDARWLSVPPQVLNPLIQQRARGCVGGEHARDGEEFML